MYMNYVIKMFLLFIISNNALIASFNINPQFGIFSNSNTTKSVFTFSIPIEIKYNINEHLKIKHINRLYHINHPQKRYMFYSDFRSNTTAITEVSFIKYKNKNTSIKVGRDYIDINQELFFSKYSTSFDHLKINLSKDKFKYNYFLIRLSNNTIKCENTDFNCINIWNDNSNHYINRWYYYRDITFKLNNKISIYLSESIISTGENRTIEWYYLTPLGLFIAEQNHNNQRKEGDVQMNNDNSFIGLGLNYSINKNLKLRTTIIIDDFQIDSKDRPIYQDVFGTSSKIIYKKNNINFSLGIHYSSPWLYLNDGIFTNYINNNYPIGLRSPHLYLIEFHYVQIFKDSKINFTTIFGEKGKQNLNTNWNPEYNNINYFDFAESIPLELYLKYEFGKNKKIPNLIFSHNWMGQKGSSLIFEWEYFKK